MVLPTLLIDVFVDVVDIVVGIVLVEEVLVGVLIWPLLSEDDDVITVGLLLLIGLVGEMRWCL